MTFRRFSTKNKNLPKVLEIPKLSEKDKIDQKIEIEASKGKQIKPEEDEDYEKDYRRRMGGDADQPQRLKYKPLRKAG